MTPEDVERLAQSFTLACLRIASDNSLAPVHHEREALMSAIRSVFAERDALRTRMREIYEVYAGSEGFIPETAPEAYQQRLIKQMVALAAQEKP